MPWTVDGSGIGTVFEEERTYKELTLKTRVGVTTLDSNVRPLRSHAGKYEMKDRDNGGFRVTDTTSTGSANTYTVSPPSERSPPRTSGSYHVKDYSEEIVDQDANQYTATITFVANTQRDTSSGLTETAGTTDWEFTLHTGTVATGRVESGARRSTRSNDTKLELNIVLDNPQTRVFEESLAYLGSVRVRQTPDGDVVVEDATANDRNTVTVNPPSSGDEDLIAGGSYQVKEWTTEKISADWNRMTVTFMNA